MYKPSSVFNTFDIRFKRPWDIYGRIPHLYIVHCHGNLNSGEREIVR